MNCPYCSEMMERGYIEQTDVRFPLEWYPKNRESGFLNSKRGNIKLTSSFKGGMITAHRCAKCKKIIIDEELLEV